MNKNHHVICVFGLGYVGLPTAVVFASKGFRVVGVDRDASRVDAVNRGASYIKELGLLDELLRKAISESKLRATVDVDEAVPEVLARANNILKRTNYLIIELHPSIYKDSMKILRNDFMPVDKSGNTFLFRRRTTH